MLTDTNADTARVSLAVADGKLRCGYAPGTLTAARALAMTSGGNA